MVSDCDWREMSYIKQDNGNGGKTNEDAMEVIDRYHLDGLKRKKTLAKAAYTRARRKTMTSIDSDPASRRKTRETLQQIDEAQQVALEIMGKIAVQYKSCNDLKNVQEVSRWNGWHKKITTEVTEWPQAQA